ncbi:MAG TPA: bifunctional glutamate N-acetyltransferase/amino-acid acetyltransferase ArgJ [Pyrinomonadaceae bacterium]|nr:bifunctional glutamate N-acetyltransferase/amino-acid acetyltransferase ArgJ [Pyrinomonadaceae bacterium]
MSSHRLKTIPGSICAPRGFKAAAVFCDIKRIGTGKGSEKGRKDDLALIMSDVPAAVAGMFTTNQVCAAPVKVSARNAARKFARAIVVNSGNANACTGARGIADAESMTKFAAESLGIEAREVLVCSTGRIGVPMPMANVKRGIVDAAGLLSGSRSSARQAAKAIMTSDTRRKEIAVEFSLGDAAVRIGGICKGAGMIQPGMSRTGKGPAAGLHATMLGFITTDAAVEPEFLKQALEQAIAQSFNRITVDGDMSTNDTVLILANGLAGNSPIGMADGTREVGRNSLRTAKRLQKKPYQDQEIFQRALDFVTLELAKMIVRDGEGVTRFVTLRVHGGRSEGDAEAIARSIANSTLVKTSWFGGDPNWGRILCAIGYSNAKVDEARVDVGYSRPGENKITFAVRHGQPTRVALQTLGGIVGQPEFDLHIFLNTGRHDCVVYTSDLTEEYVEFNKGNLSDPKSLGG